MANHLQEQDPEKFGELVDLILAGASQRDCHLMLNISTATAGKCMTTVFRILKAMNLPPPVCPCGQPAGHNSWCAFRIKYSDAKQSAIAAGKTGMPKAKA